MKISARTTAITLALAASLGATPAFAHDHWHRPHWGAGIYLGAPWPAYPPPIYYGPPVYYGPPIVIREAPPVYVERGSPGYWYYCDRPSGYYPYVKECFGTWRAVPPEPGR